MLSSAETGSWRFASGWVSRRLSCDGCDAEIVYKITKAGLISAARSRGWVIGRLGDFCSSDCRRRHLASRTERQVSQDRLASAKFDEGPPVATLGPPPIVRLPDGRMAIDITKPRQAQDTLEDVSSVRDEK